MEPKGRRFLIREFKSRIRPRAWEKTPAEERKTRMERGTWEAARRRAISPEARAKRFGINKMRKVAIDIAKAEERLEGPIFERGGVRRALVNPLESGDVNFVLQRTDNLGVSPDGRLVTEGQYNRTTRALTRGGKIIAKRVSHTITMPLGAFKKGIYEMLWTAAHEVNHIAVEEGVVKMKKLGYFFESYVTKHPEIKGDDFLLMLTKRRTNEEYELYKEGVVNLINYYGLEGLMPENVRKRLLREQLRSIGYRVSMLPDVSEIDKYTVSRFRRAFERLSNGPKRFWGFIRAVEGWNFEPGLGDRRGIPARTKTREGH
jgi:hypothetical protein